MNENQQSKFYVLSAVWCGCIALFGFLLCIIVGLSLANLPLILGATISLPFGLITVLVGRTLNNVLFNVAKSKPNKAQIMLLAIGLNLVKYIILLIPVIVGLSINLGIGYTLFNPFVLVIFALIYPMTILIVQWYFVKVNKKKSSDETKPSVVIPPQQTK